MPNGFVWIALSGAILFSMAGLFTLWALWSRKESLRNAGLMALTLVGPVSLGVCWKAQIGLIETDAVFWGRLMSGDVSKLWGIGSLGLIAGTGLALGALALQERAKGIVIGALAFALSWIVLYLHPTPHYVPMPAWQDKLVWFALLVGGAAVCLVIYAKFQSHFKFLQTPAAMIAGVVPLLALGYSDALFLVQKPLNLSQLEPTEQIRQMGCLSCHTMNGAGYPHPGGGLESVASRTEEAIRSFLADPSGENARKLGIRANPTGEMGGVHLSEADVNALTEALKSLFAIKPPAIQSAGLEQVQPILTEKTCLACHSLKGEGAAQGGIGGPLEAASKLEESVLIEWLKKPSAENAATLKIRETPTGAMEVFALPEEQAKVVASWLKTLTE